MGDRPTSWLRLNAYGVLISLLEIFIFIFYAAEHLAPHPDHAGHLADWVAHGGIGLAGVGLLYSYVRRRVDVEVYASVLLAASNLAAFFIEVYASTPPEFDLRGSVLQVIIIVTVGMRISALYQGGSLIIPSWGRR